MAMFRAPHHRRINIAPLSRNRWPRITTYGGYQVLTEGMTPRTVMVLMGPREGNHMVQQHIRAAIALACRAKQL